MVYVDDAIFMGPGKEEIDKCISDMGSIFNLQDEGDISDYLGIKVTHLSDGKIKLAQPHLIESIIQDLNFMENTKPKQTPALATVILQRDLDGAAFDEHWEYRSVIGKLNFLEKSTRPDIAYAVHQCARFSANPKKSHALAIQHIVRYLVGTKDKGLLLNPAGTEFNVYVDSDFCGTWDRATAGSDAMTAKSRSGHVITYANCPISWSSKLQTEVGSVYYRSRVHGLFNGSKRRDSLAKFDRRSPITCGCKHQRNAYDLLRSVRGQLWSTGDGKITKDETTHQTHKCEISSFSRSC